MLAGTSLVGNKWLLQWILRAHHTCGGNKIFRKSWTSRRRLWGRSQWGGWQTIIYLKKKKSPTGWKEAASLCLRLDCNCSVLPPSLWSFHFSYSVKPGQRSRGKDLFFPHSFLPSQTKGNWIWETRLEPNELEEDQSENTLRSKRRALLKGMGHHLRIISRGADALLVSEPQSWSGELEGGWIPGQYKDQCVTWGLGSYWNLNLNVGS